MNMKKIIKKLLIYTLATGIIICLTSLYHLEKKLKEFKLIRQEVLSQTGYDLNWDDKIKTGWWIGSNAFLRDANKKLNKKEGENTLEIKEWLIQTKRYLNLLHNEDDNLLTIWANQGFTCHQAAKKYMELRR